MTTLLVRITRDAGGLPVFFVPAAGSTVLSFAHLARSLKPRRPFYGFDLNEIEGAQLPLARLGDLSEMCLAEIRTVQKSGPYNLGGHCWGSILAFDIAARLEAEGEQVAALVLLEALPPRGNRSVESRPGTQIGHDGSEPLVEADETLKIMFEQIDQNLSRLPVEQAERYGRASRKLIGLGSRHRANPIAAPITLLRTPSHPDVVFQGWIGLTGDFKEHVIHGDAHSMLRNPDVKILGAQLGRVLNAHDGDKPLRLIADTEGARSS